MLLPVYVCRLLECEHDKKHTIRCCPFMYSLSLSLSPHLTSTDDIEVLFYEEKNDTALNPVQPWSAKGRFGPNDVHHQYAIVFQTPPFYNLAIERPVTVWIALRRPSDNELSEAKPFLYLPQEFGETLTIE